MATKPSSPPAKRTGPSPTIPRGATARSAATQKLPGLNTHRRSASRHQPSSAPVVNGDAHEALTASLKQETDQKEQLLVQLQDKDQLLTNYVIENTNLTSALSAAENRLNELYGEQSRWEVELAQRLDITEKLREQVRELEKEKRDLQRRYNEQTATFEAERQAFYDNEQHLKSRIQTLSQVARKRAESNARSVEIGFEPEDGEASLPVVEQTEEAHQDLNGPENEPAEMTSLKLELSTLSTSHASLQSTLVLMQTQLVDLKRVNQELQEENESYMILLREKTLSGQFDLIKQVGAGSITSEDEGSEEDRGSTDIDSIRSQRRSTLDIVQEEPFEGLDSEALADTSDSDMHSHRNSRYGHRKRGSSCHATLGESLAGLPITGPGLDLAAELGRAENKNILAGTTFDDGERQPPSKSKRGKKDAPKLPHSASANMEEIEVLRTEVKSLKDANKALSLYASKIIDRIIAQEGFEHVLAADYEKEPTTPLAAIPHSDASKSPPFSQSTSKPRPQSMNVGQSAESTLPKPPSMTKLNTKAQRRSLSFDWKFSLFHNDRKSDPAANLRPLTLKPGTPVTGGRKLDNIEDEEDKKERERLNATMKLLGYDRETQGSTALPNPTGKSKHRFPLPGPRMTGPDVSDTCSIHSTSSSTRPSFNNTSDLTHEALERAEAEQSLSALDARERDLSAEIAKGGGGGFTEMAPRSSKRGRSGEGSSGSTVWSAGMSGNGDE